MRFPHHGRQEFDFHIDDFKQLSLECCQISFGYARQDGGIIGVNWCDSGSPWLFTSFVRDWSKRSEELLEKKHSLAVEGRFIRCSSKGGLMAPYRLVFRNEAKRYVVRLGFCVFHDRVTGVCTVRTPS